MMNEVFAKPCAGALIEREIDGVPCILVQTRQKPGGAETNGKLEIPAGKIREHECIFDTLRREVYEETGLTVTHIEGEDDAVSSAVCGHETVSFEPFCITENLSGAYGIVLSTFLCRAEGTPLEQTEEAEDIRWMTADELRDIVDNRPDSVFFMHVNALRKWLKACDCLKQNGSEWIDVYHESGKKTGRMKKSEAHQCGALHRSVCVWIVNNRGEILLQQRSSRVAFPNMLDVSFAGHIRSGESPLEAIMREGQEELGLTVDPSGLRYLFSCREQSQSNAYHENEIEEVFLYRTNLSPDAFRFPDGEVQRVLYLPVFQFADMVARHDASLIPYQNMYTQLLSALQAMKLS